VTLVAPSPPQKLAGVSRTSRLVWVSATLYGDDVRRRCDHAVPPSANGIARPAVPPSAAAERPRRRTNPAIFAKLPVVNRSLHRFCWAEPETPPARPFAARRSHPWFCSFFRAWRHPPILRYLPRAAARIQHEEVPVRRDIIGMADRFIHPGVGSYPLSSDSLSGAPRRTRSYHHAHQHPARPRTFRACPSSCAVRGCILTRTAHNNVPIGLTVAETTWISINQP
jgi:hypothetical protein